MSDQPNADQTATPALPEKASVWEDFIDIFYAPSTVFARRENGNFWIPMLFLAIVLGAMFFVSADALRPAMDGDFARMSAAQMKKNPQITAEMMNQSRAMQEKVSKFIVPVVIPILILGIALTMWLVGKVVGAKQTWNAALVVASYATFPRLLEGVINGAQGMLLNPDNINGMMRLRLGPTHFMDPDTTSALLIALLSRVDIFTMWVTVLLAIGLSVTGKISRSQAAIAAALTWLVGALPTLIPALLAG